MLLLVLGLPRLAFAFPPPAQVGFEAGNAAFAAGDYPKAAVEFDALRVAEHLSPAILYNLANAESKAGRPGLAILHYEQALVLAPRDPDILANLARTRTHAGLEGPKRSSWENLARQLTVDQWAWLSMSALWIGCLLLVANALRPAAWQSAPRLLGVSTLALSLVLLMTGALSMTRFAQLRQAVLTGPRPTLRVAPFGEASASVELSAGQLIRIDSEHGGFALVRTDDDQTGWIPTERVRRILPRPGP